MVTLCSAAIPEVVSMFMLHFNEGIWTGTGIVFNNWRCSVTYFKISHMIHSLLPLLYTLECAAVGEVHSNILQPSYSCSAEPSGDPL